MSGTMRDLTPGFALEGTYTVPQLFAGDQEVVTTSLPLAASTAIAENTVLALNTSGYLVPVDPAQTDGRQTPVAISVQANASSGSVRNIAVYVGGFFNHAALVWPAGLNTLALRRAAFLRTNITIGELKAVRAPG